MLTVFIMPLSTDFGWTRMRIAVAIGFGAVIGTFTAPCAEMTFDITQSYHSAFVTIL